MTCAETKTFAYKKTSVDAVAPFKARASDTGFDLTLIKEWKRKGNVVFYDTGIAVEPPHGYYFDLVPRSSISSTGYVMANSVGIIDCEYRDSVKVPLIKVDETAPDIVLPVRLAQLVPRKLEPFVAVEVSELSQTERGLGGFGSTGK